MSGVWAVVKPLRPHALSVGQARNFCIRRLSSVLGDSSDDSEALSADLTTSSHAVSGIHEVVADTAAIATELVTNAVAAGSSKITLFLGLTASDVRIEVADNATGSVTPSTPTTRDAAGRGLMIVAGLARDWGVAPDAIGKQVWAEVPRGGRSR